MPLFRLRNFILYQARYSQALAQACGALVFDRNPHKHSYVYLAVVVRPWEECLGNNKVQWKAIAIKGRVFFICGKAVGIW